MKTKNFIYTEIQYNSFIRQLEHAEGIELTEFEAGLSRAILDIQTKQGNKAAAALGNSFKKEIKRFINLGLIHADTFKFTGMAAPCKALESTIASFISNHYTSTN